MAEKDDKKSGDDALKLITEQMQNIGNTVSNMGQVMMSMQQNMDLMNQRINEPRDSNRSDSSQQIDLDSLDLERMDRKDFAKVLLKAASQEISPLIRNVQKGVSDVDIATKRNALQSELTSMLKDDAYSDLPYWKAEITEFLKQHPDMSARRAIAIIRDENPDKKAQIDAQIESARKDANDTGDTGDTDDGKDTAGKNPRGSKPNRGLDGDRKHKTGSDDADKDTNDAKKGNFGGMPPGDANTDERRSTSMEQEDAVSSAMDEVMARHEGIESIISGEIN